MGSKKIRIRPRRRFWLSFQWRLLLSTLGLMWVVIFVLAFYQYDREEKVRQLSINSYLDMTNNSIIDAYLGGFDVKQFLAFVDEFYSNTNYTGVRISIYDYNGDLLCSVGEPMDFDPDRDGYSAPGEDVAGALSKVPLRDSQSRDGERMFYCVSQKSADGKIIAATAMPYTQFIDDSMAHRNRIWLVIFPILLIVTVVVYFFVNHIAKSVRLLATFADRVVAGERFEESDKFPDDEFGNIARHIVAIYRQKSEAMVESENEHKVAMNAILEKAKMKREMSNNINHELKTPVGIIKGYVDTIVGQPDMDAATMRHFIERASVNVDRLVDLINNLSLVTRLEDGMRQITLSNVDFHDMVYAIADDLRQSGVTGGMKFNFNLPLNCIVHANPSMLHSAIYNLIRNSVRHSHGSGMWIELIGENDRYYTFRYYDDGVGVPPESLGKLFDRFYRVDSGRSRKVGDTGLGLPIVKSSIEAMGGAISVKNRSTGGLEFIFTLAKKRES